MGETESDMLSFHVRRVIVTALLLLIYGDGSGTKHTQSASAAEILAVPNSRNRVRLPRVNGSPVEALSYLPIISLEGSTVDYLLNVGKSKVNNQNALSTPCEPFYLSIELDIHITGDGKWSCCFGEQVSKTHDQLSINYVEKLERL
ncbi:hypothetical protein WN944_020327 [Citrus x changshan-huyou]|uniref:Uncharacterized protein n=1 Tax=Citrus x changshan-huyou TaxID=2935761 RepID=A0AAP0LZV9_9ROSI